MPLTAGRTLLHYEILGPLGAGGMGEVWRARDTRLEREVAIKVLPDELACGEHLQRFQREARTLGALSHPNLAHVYGFERIGDTCFIAMELVPGEDLEERLERAPLRLEEAIDLCRQVAAGLEAAHDAGVVHRDLKPANVRCTPDGDVKVIDFGLAKPLAAHDGAPEAAYRTQDGRILGTPAHMAPEQLRGAQLDRRVDVWAFGCLLYECLTGKRAFVGESLSDVVAAVLGSTPDLDALPPGTPPRLRVLLERCLRKDVRRRLRDIGDVRLELEEVLGGGDSGSARPRPRWSPATSALLVALGAACGIAVGVAAAKSHDGGEPIAGATGRYTISLPPELVLDSPSGLAAPLAVSRDGRTIAFVAQDGDGVRRVYLRGADEPAVRAVPGTEGADYPFFSHDGKQLGFAYAGGSELNRVDLAVGTVQRIPIDGVGVRGACWTADDTLVLGLFDQGLARFPVGGGGAERLTRPADDELYHCWPQVLADEDTVLFTAAMRDGRLEPRLLSLESGEIAALDTIGGSAHYVPGGTLVFSRSDEILAVRLDLDERRVVGEPVVLVSGVQVSIHGTPCFAVAGDGDILVHEPVRPPSPGRGLVWVDREGRPERLAAGRAFEFPDISPDGRQIAVAVHSPSGHDIWTVDTQRAVETLVVSNGNNLEPKWSPTGESLVFASAADTNLYRQGLWADAEPERLLDREGQQVPLAWTPGGRLLFLDLPSRSRGDLLELDPADGTVRGLGMTQFNESAGGVSPDGEWLAYVSDETGSMEIYLRKYPALGPKLRVTTGGGVEPVWSPVGRELFFRHGHGLYAIDVSSDPGEPLGEPKLLFEGEFEAGYYGRPNYAVAPDGERFVMVEKGLGLTQGRLDVALGLPTQLRALFTDQPR